MHVILIPGFWLDASAWDEITPVLEEAGHRVRALTLPGLESPAADRSGIRLQDHVNAVIAALDEADESAGPVMLVGHSGGGPIAYAAADARPGRVARIVYIDAGPLAAGQAINDGLPVVDGEIPLPDWSVFDDGMLVDLTDELRASFRARAVPEPKAVAYDPLTLSDDKRRYDVPATVIACEVPSEQIQKWVEQEHPYVAELAALRDVEFVDLPTSHWPMFTKPTELGQAIVSALT